MQRSARSPPAEDGSCGPAPYGGEGGCSERRLPAGAPSARGTASAHRSRSFRQGFLTNITNPKMLVFYLSLLPQFVGAEAPFWTWLLHAWTLPVVGTAWLLAVAVVGSALRETLLQPVARRVVDAVSGLALLGFGARLALDRA